MLVRVHPGSPPEVPSRPRDCGLLAVKCPHPRCVLRVGSVPSSSSCVCSPRWGHRSRLEGTGGVQRCIFRALPHCLVVKSLTRSESCTSVWASQEAPMVENPPASVGDTGSIPGSGRSPGGGNGNTPQSSCLWNCMDRGAWRATVHRVAQHWILLKRLSTLVQGFRETSLLGFDCYSSMQRWHVFCSFSADTNAVSEAVEACTTAS